MAAASRRPDAQVVVKGGKEGPGKVKVTGFGNRVTYDLT